MAGADQPSYIHAQAPTKQLAEGMASFPALTSGSLQVHGALLAQS